ncbi:MAG: hypothetical protein RLZZ480_802 [Candidatus Parcubacteria bacterium]|jgi:8-oxo-dGTP pyrophosphatase MutT (NUDIX family)
MSKPFERTCLCLVIVDEKVLLLERQNTWYENGKYLPPGGIVDNDEEPETAAVRELFEETGLVVNKKDLVLVNNYQNELNGRLFDNYHFITTTCTGVAINKEPERHSNMDWFPICDLPNNASEVVHAILEKI